MHFQIKYFEKQLLSQYQICSWCTSIKHERCIFELKKKKKDSSDVLKSFPPFQDIYRSKIFESPTIHFFLLKHAYLVTSTILIFSSLKNTAVSVISESDMIDYLFLTQVV
jgi:hypothetical protein